MFLVGGAYYEHDQEGGMQMGRALKSLAAIALLSMAPSLVHAQTWPNRFVRFIVPFAAGGAADVVTRIVVAKMSENMGTTLIVENKTGASGKIGTEYVAKSKPDGYTILVGSPGTLAINPNVFSQLPYDVNRDFVAISHVATFPQILTVNEKAPVRSLKDFVAYVKSRPKALSYGSSGIGSTGHLITAMFMHEAGLDAVHVPYRGGGPAAQALAAGNVDFVIDGLPTFQGLIASKDVRILAITSAQKWPALPEVPTIGEEVIPGFDLSSWVVFAAPKGTPKDICDRLAKEAAKALTSDEVVTRLFQVGALPAGDSPAEAERFVSSELSKWKKVADVTGTKLD
jgi:tripartite-type tricarboxylate transporter receptor subunit TctC